MSIPGAVIVAVVAYAAILGFFLYICVFADVNKNATARYLSVTLPRIIWDKVTELLGTKAVSILEGLVSRALVLIYCAVVFGAWSVIFWYVYPWVDDQSYVSAYHKYIGYAVFAACVGSWRTAMTTSPGVITKRNVGRYNHFPYDDMLFPADRVCSTTGVPKLARSKFDRFKYRHNVARFDHFCGWVYNCIGEENYRYFLLFLVVHAAMCLYGAVMVGMLFYGEVLERDLFSVTFFNRLTGEEMYADKWIIFQYLSGRHMLPTAVFFLMAVMGVALTLFLAYHCWLTSKGMTTNESYKWGEVHRWYKTELRRYQNAVKNGEIHPTSSKKKDKNNSNNNNKNHHEATSQQQQQQPPKAPPISDGDVTCTPTPGGGGAAATGTDPAASQQQQAQLPPLKLQTKCLEVLKALQSHDHAWVFNAPVDPVELGLPDYLEVVKEPMDLGTVRKNLGNGLYRTPEGFEEHVHLTFDNAMLYNPAGSVVYNMAKEMKTKFEVDFQKLTEQLNAEEDKKRRNGEQQQQRQQQQQQSSASSVVKAVVDTADDDGDTTSLFDPGPPPVNIYDRGFIENWKEVLFPISLRQDRSIAVSSNHKPKAV